MTTKQSTLYSIVNQKCPRCHEGNMFAHSTFSSHFTTMHAQCPHCGLDLMQEPSFYWGAMYFSYAIQVAVFVAVYLVLHFTIDPGPWMYVLAMCLGVVAILPLNYRLSRVLWINLFIHYQPAHHNISKL